MKRALLAVVGLGLLLACVETAQAADAQALYGKVVSVDTTANTIVVKPKTGDNVTVSTNADTKIKVNDKEATLADIKADMMIRVAPATGVAKAINAFTPKAGGSTQALSGTIVSVDAAAGTLVVKPAEGDNVTVTTNADTTVRLDEHAAKLADLKAGMTVKVIPATGAPKYVVAKTPKASA